MDRSLTELIAQRWQRRVRLELGEVAALGLCVAFVIFSFGSLITGMWSDYWEWNWETVVSWSRWADAWDVSVVFALGVVVVGWWQTPVEVAREDGAFQNVHYKRSTMILRAGVTIAVFIMVAIAVNVVATWIEYGGQYGGPLLSNALGGLVLSFTGFVIGRRILRANRELKENYLLEPQFETLPDGLSQPRGR